MKNAFTIRENANVGDGRPASRLVKSSPPALFYFILTPPNAGSHGIRGLQGFTVYTFNIMVNAKPLIYKAFKV